MKLHPPLAVAVSCGFILLAARPAAAATYVLDLVELSQSASITEHPGGGFPGYEGVATDVLPDSNIFTVTAEIPEAVGPPVFGPSVIHVPERWGSIGLIPPDAASLLVIEFSASVSFFLESPTLSGIDDDYLIRVLRNTTEVYTGRAGTLSEPLLQGDTIEMPRQTILRSGATNIGGMGRASNITVYGVQIVPEPCSLLLALSSISLAALRRRR